MTIHGGSWRRAEMVGWLVTCATDIGLCALISIIKVSMHKIINIQITYSTGLSLLVLKVTV